MAYQGSTEYKLLNPGADNIQWMQVAASQTLEIGDPTKLVAGLVTLTATKANTQITNAAQQLGLTAAVSYTFNSAGSKVPLAVSTLIPVMCYNDGTILVLPTATSAPAVTNIGSTFTGIMTTAGQLQIDMGTTANPVFQIYGMEYGDNALTPYTQKATPVVGDRVLVRVISTVRTLG